MVLFLAENMPSLKMNMLKSTVCIKCLHTQNGRGWKGPTEVTLSSSFAQAAAPPRAGCPGPWKSPRREAPQPLWANWASALSPAANKNLKVLPDVQMENITLREMFSWKYRRNFKHLTNVYNRLFFFFNALNVLRFSTSSHLEVGLLTANIFLTT